MMSDSQEAADYMSTWGTCSFWMEGVLLTSIGKRIETLEIALKVVQSFYRHENDR